jgi:hypothetical protein
MAYVSASVPGKVDGAFGAKNICRIVGFVCILGFLFDMLVLALPPQGSAEWRIGLVQEFANRSIIFLFGLALIIYGSVGNSNSRLRFFSKLSMGFGVLFFLLCLLSVVDTIRLNQQALGNISTQEAQLKTQIDQARANPEALPENIDLTAIDQVSEQLSQQAVLLKKNTKRTVFKTGVSNIGNLVLVGAGLLGLGRCGMGLSRSRG